MAQELTMEMEIDRWNDDGGCCIYFEVIRTAACQHVFVEAVDEDGQLLEPPFDVCINCGQVIY